MQSHVSRVASACLAGFAVLLLSACGNSRSGGPAPTPAPRTLTVELTGTGGGLVTSSPAGISCGSTCSAPFANGTSVTLTAAPATDSVFSGWSGGGCSGTSTCTLTLASNTTVTAAFTSATPQTPAEVVALTTTNKLISFERDTPDSAPVSSVDIVGLGSSETVVAIDYRPVNQTLYGVTSQARVCALDPASGVASGCAELRTNPQDASTRVNLSGTTRGVDFNPVADRLRVVTGAGQNLRVNVETGATTVDTPLNGDATGANASSYNNTFTGTVGGTVLFIIQGNSLYVQNPPNDGTLTLIGALGVTGDGVDGFDIAGNQSAFAALNVSGLPRLYRINLGTGEATLVASINTGDAPGTRISGLAIKPSGTAGSGGDTFALLANNQLISFDRADATVILSQTIVAGLAGGEQLVGIDFRPTNAKLYGIGSGGNLYLIDTVAGLATRVAPLTADSGSGFGGLAGTDFGLDFSPAPLGSDTKDRLQVTSSSGQNLRVDADNGKVLQETNVNEPNPNNPAQQINVNASAAAFTNSVAGANPFSTSQPNVPVLYVVDAAKDRLVTVRQTTGTPNIPVGRISVVGALGRDIDAGTGFDIDGVNGQAYAALVEAGVSKWFRVNLGTGALTEIGFLGDGSLQLRGLALRPPARPVVYALTSNNRLLQFDVLSPGQLLANQPITGLDQGATLLSIEYRPTDGKLLGVSSNDKIYEIAPGASAGADAVASNGHSLRPFAGDLSNAFSTLAGGSFGIDANPLFASGFGLRVVSDASSGNNLRIDSATGDVITDGNLRNEAMTPATAVAIAHTNSFAGAADTVLYAIDVDTSQLYTLATDESGSMSAVDPTSAPIFGLSPPSFVGFDIAGGHNGLALVSAAAGGASTLNRIDLSSGTLTEIGAIGQAATEVRSLAVKVVRAQ